MKKQLKAKLKIKAFLVLVAVGLFGCDASGARDSASQNTDTENAEVSEAAYPMNRSVSSMYAESMIDAFASYRRLCQTSHGTFDESSKLCDCGEGYSFGKDGASYRCEMVLQGEYGTLNALGTQVIFNQPQTVSAHRSSFVGVSNGAGSNLNYLYVIDAISPMLSMKDAAELWAGQYTPQLEYTTTEGHSAAIATLVTSKQNVLGVYARQKSEFQPSSRANSGLRIQVEAVLSVVKAAPQREQMIRRSDSGCVEGCDLLREWKLRSGQTVRQDKVYYGGGIYQNRYTLISAEHKPELLIALTPNDSLNYVAEITQARSETRFVEEVQLYSANLLPLTTAPIKNERDLSILNQVRSKMAMHGETLNRPQVVLCEAGVGVGHVNQYGPQQFLLGPSVDQSAWGWTEANQYSLDTEMQSDGRTGIHFSAGFEKQESLLNSHGAAVLGVFFTGEKSSFPVLSVVSPEVCADPNEKWNEKMLSHSDARVVNGSYSDVYSPEACKNSSVAKKIKTTAETLLWVFAAGNEYMNLDENAPAICPQNLLDQRNLIKVAAGNANHIERYSNRGFRSVDLVADGRGMGQNAGTSFAAPRVSKVAALIHLKAPSLTIAEIKKAILYSVDFDPDHKLEVSSGGALNADRALAMALYQVHFQPHNDLEWVQSQFCGKKSNSCYESRQRVRFWTRTGLWSE